MRTRGALNSCAGDGADSPTRAAKGGEAARQKKIKKDLLIFVC
jgi:hypothetical protein